MILVRANGISISFNSSQSFPVLRNGKSVRFVKKDDKGKKINPLDVAVGMKLTSTTQIEFSDSVELLDFVCGLLASGFEIKPKVLVALFEHKSQVYKKLQDLFSKAKEDDQKLRYFLQQLILPRTLASIQLGSEAVAA